MARPGQIICSAHGIDRGAAGRQERKHDADPDGAAGAARPRAGFVDRAHLPAGSPGSGARCRINMRPPFRRWRAHHPRHAAGAPGVAGHRQGQTLAALEANRNRLLEAYVAAHPKTLRPRPLSRRRCAMTRWGQIPDARRRLLTRLLRSRPQWGDCRIHTSRYAAQDQLIPVILR